MEKGNNSQFAKYTQKLASAPCLVWFLPNAQKKLAKAEYLVWYYRITIISDICCFHLISEGVHCIPICTIIY